MLRFPAALGLLLGLAFFAACAREEPPARATSARQGPVAAPPGSVAAPPGVATQMGAPAATEVAARGLAPLPMLGTELSQDRLLEEILARRVLRFKPVGSTSIVYRMMLDGRVDAAFKPRTRAHPAGHLAEIAAYRLGRLLGLDDVPPAVTRRVAQERLHDRLDPDFEDSWPDIVEGTLWDEDGGVTGAAIYWIPDMRDLELERSGPMTRWSRRLKQGQRIPDDLRALHADLSRMLAFDYLIANWDRWSGANAQGLPDGRRLFIRDHNVAFSSPLRPALHERVLGHLLRCQKFSRSFVDRLRRMTEGAVRTELSLDPGAIRALALSDAQIAELMQRRRTLMSYIGSLVAMYGEERVLVFP